MSKYIKLEDILDDYPDAQVSVTELPEEKWASVTEANGYYVSDKGRVLRALHNPCTKRCRIFIMSPQNNSKGYKRVSMKRGGVQKLRFVHRLVAELFIPNPKGYPQVNHKDGDKHNNNADNLEWCNNSINQRHSLANRLRTPVYREVILTNKITGEKKTFPSIIAASKFLGYVGASAAQLACKNGNTSRGYIIEMGKRYHEPH